MCRTGDASFQRYISRQLLTGTPEQFVYTVSGVLLNVNFSNEMLSITDVNIITFSILKI